MSEPTLVAGLMPEPEQREATCACGAAFTQSRLVWPSGRKVGWGPARCQRCEAADLQTHHAESRLRTLAIPPRYETATLEAFALHGDEANRARLNRLGIMARRFVVEWPQPAQEILVFRGGPGTGKGHLAWAIARAVVLQSGAAVVFIKLPTLIRDLREGWRREGESEATRLRRYREPDLLIVDEVSRHAFYGEPTQHLYDVLDHRLDYCRPTIVTTNETEVGFTQLVGQALVDRIIGYGGLVEFGEVSYRARSRGVS